MEINRLTGDGTCLQCTENPIKDAGDADFSGHCQYPVLREVR